MLALRDDEMGGVDAEVPATAHTALRLESSDAQAEEQIASQCKQLSYELYTAIDALASAVEHPTTPTTTVPIPMDTLRAWLCKLRELNCTISEYARASIARVDRLQIDAALAQNAMASDLLDREACHTHTLETISRMQLDDGQAMSTRVARAMKQVMQLHATTAPFTFSAPQGYFGAADCTGANHE